MTVEFDLSAPPVPPRDAATVVPIRDGPSGLEILFVRRHADIRFMGGAHVFPGGKLDASDMDTQIASDMTEHQAAARLADGDPRRALGLFVAGARECLEEAGVFFAVQQVKPEEISAMQQALLAQAPLAKLLAERGITLALRALVPWSRWITPRGEKRRFDARFFVAQAPAGAIARHDANETTATVWLNPADALRRAQEREIVLVPPTYRTVEVLRRHANTASVLASSAQDLTPIEPVVLEDAGDPVVVLPDDPLHPNRCAGDSGYATRFRYRDGAWTAESLGK